MNYIALIPLWCLLVVSIYAQEGESPTESPIPAARTGYAAVRVEDFPRDQNGFLTSEIWNVIEAEAKANPNSNEARTLRGRPIYQAYYAQYAGWTPPPPLPATNGYLRNLSDTPKEPRFPLTDKVWPAKPGEASVCLWEDDKLAAMSIGIDDNCAMDVSYWRELSKKYGGLNITWNLITCNIDGALNKGGSVVMAGKWSLWRDLVKEGYHLASHSVTHNHDPVPSDGWPGPEWEAAESLRQIDSNVPGQRTRIFAYPGSGVRAFGTPRGLVEKAYRPAIAKYYVGARAAGRNALNQANMTDYFNIAATTGGIPLLLDSNNKTMAVERIKNYQDQNINNLFAADPKSPYHKYYRGWANIFIHFINSGKDFEKNPYTIALGEVLDFYNQHREELWTGFIDDIALYGQERDVAMVTTDEAADNIIKFTIVSKMEPATFDYPLTIKVRLPDQWKSVEATNDKTVLPARVILHEGAPYALVKVAPNRGQVTLRPGSSQASR